MPEIIITVRDKLPVNTGDIHYIVTDNSDYTVRFVFDDDWAEGEKTVYFVRSNGCVYKPQKTTDDMAVIPVQKDAGAMTQLLIGVQQGDIKTSRPCALNVYPSITDIITDESVQPDGTLWEDLMARIKALEEDEGVSQEEVEAAVKQYFEANPIDPAEIGAVSADQGAENADKILGIGEDGKVIPVDKPQGDVKTVAGVKPDASGNVPLTASDVGASPGVYYGSDEPSEEYDVWIDPNGNESEWLTAESIKTALGYTPADEEAVDSLSEEIDELRKQGGISSIEMRDADPTGEDLTEGRIWILRVGDNTLTIPVIELGNVSDNSITIKLSNTCRDENGDVVTTYNVYVDSALNKTTTIATGGTCVIDGLSPETEYQISVRGVKDAMISEMSNTLTATTLEAPDGEQETMILAGYTIEVSDNELGVSVKTSPIRAVYVATSGNKKVPPIIDGVQYCLVEVPEDAISCTVSCDGFMWGFNGWNTGSDGKLTYDVDSGWKSSGETYRFKAGAAEYVTIGFKKASDGSEAITQEDVAGITVTFSSEPEIVFVLGLSAVMNGGNIQLNKYGSKRANGFYTVGEKALVDEQGNDSYYYPIPVPADSTSVTVTCPNLMYGYCGYNLSDENNYSYDVDSGWKNSGVTYTFAAGAAEYATISLKKADNSELTADDIANITVAFA